MKWISVKDEQPPKDCNFLAYVVEGAEYADDASAGVNACFVDDKGFVVINYAPFPVVISHWMPLPEPPMLDNGGCAE